MFTCISSKFLVYYVARTCRTTYTKAAKTRAIDREPAPHTEHAQYLKWALTKWQSKDPIAVRPLAFSNPF